MPEFLHRNQKFYTPVEYALSKIGGTYKMPVLWRLKDRPWRYTELRQSIGRISDRMLSKTLRELEADGFVLKRLEAGVPVRAYYSLSARGTEAIPVIGSLRQYGFALMEAYGISHP